MITVAEATTLLFSSLYKPGSVHLPLSAATGRVLAENVLADRPFPPFDRVSMDGIAIKSMAVKAGIHAFAIKGVQYAGEPPRHLPEPHSALEVMTGAVLSAGADAVVRYEDVEIRDGMAYLTIEDVRKGQNIHIEGSDHPQGALLLPAGTVVRAPEIAVLATVGISSPKVLCLPKVSVVATGNELVPVTSKPGPYQIRSSNSEALASSLSQRSMVPEVFHLADDKATMKTRLTQILGQSDVLILTGGVSKGKADYLPEVLEELGVTKVFHQVAQKPGKPFWFGQYRNETFVFAFPGNPVSAFICFYRYFIPWLNRSLGLPVITIYARLHEDFTFNPQLTYFLPVAVSSDSQGILWATPRPGGGSGDHANLLRADGFLELPAGLSHFCKGESFQYYSFGSEK